MTNFEVVHPVSDGPPSTPTTAIDTATGTRRNASASTGTPDRTQAALVAILLLTGVLEPLPQG